MREELRQNFEEPVGEKKETSPLEKEYEFNQAALKKALEEEIKRKISRGLSDDEKKEGLRSDVFFNIMVEYNSLVGDSRIKVDDPFALDELVKELKVLIEDLRNEGALKKIEEENNFVLKLNDKIISKEHIDPQIKKITSGLRPGIEETWGIGLGIPKDDK